MNELHSRETLRSEEQTARSVIRNKISRLKSEIEELELLDNALPWKDMTQQEEEKLFRFFFFYRR